MNMNIFYYFIDAAIRNKSIDCKFIYDITITIMFFWVFSNEIIHLDIGRERKLLSNA